MHGSHISTSADSHLAGREAKDDSDPTGLDVSLATHTGRVCLLACVGILKVCDGSVIDHKQTIM
jgi:hypothetical protein